MAGIYGVSRSGYYSWKNGSISPRKKHRADVLKVLLSAHKAVPSYGIDNLYEEVITEIHCGRNMIYSLMKENNIRAYRRTKRTTTTYSKHNLKTHENLLRQDFSATSPNQKWVADITYIPTDEGTEYLAIIKDLFTKDIVGWSIANHMRTELVASALEKAIKAEKPARGLVHHSDRGAQYCSREYQRTLENRGIIASMSRPGIPYDNACAESFFSSLKNEELFKYRFKTRAEARFVVFQYIEVFYRRQRRHSSIGRIPPLEYRERFEKSMVA